MEMSAGEIRRHYKYAKDRKKCIYILAELNCCSTDRIKEILFVSETQRMQNVKVSVDHRIKLNSNEIKSLYKRLDELDAEIKPLEDEYKRTVHMILSAESG